VGDHALALPSTATLAPAEEQHAHQHAGEGDLAERQRSAEVLGTERQREQRCAREGPD
jgi:hypothetical protein